MLKNLDTGKKYSHFQPDTKANAKNTPFPQNNSSKARLICSFFDKIVCLKAVSSPFAPHYFCPARDCRTLRFDENPES